MCVNLTGMMYDDGGHNSHQVSPNNKYMLVDSWSKLTWVGQDGIGLGEELVAADALVSFSTSVGGGNRRWRGKRVSS